MRVLGSVVAEGELVPLLSHPLGRPARLTASFGREADFPPGEAVKEGGQGSLLAAAKRQIGKPAGRPAWV